MKRRKLNLGSRKTLSSLDLVQAHTSSESSLLSYAWSVLYAALIITHGLKKDTQLKSIFKVIKQAHTNFNSHTIHFDISTPGAELRAVLQCQEHNSAHSLQNLMKTHQF